MRFTLRTYLSRILIKARRHYLFFGIVFGEIRIGVIWPAAKPDSTDSRQPELPGIS